ncbi:MAG: hypothetical protein M0R80_10390 [Proteobacteria bacterium]|nr:hypothetical protein [Pseudomonadota bacterium]
MILRRDRTSSEHPTSSGPAREGDDRRWHPRGGEDSITGYLAAHLTDAITDTTMVKLSLCRPLDPLRVDSDGRQIAVVMPVRM